MINNRQGGRRRGRGGQRPQNIGGQPGGGRQDNRQRGNAAQLLEKYKSLARDSQLAGDRVQTEYYLQFADHYFRVLGENRARFEDQRRQRGDDSDEDESDEDGVEAADEQSEDRQRPERGERRERFDRSRDRRPSRDERNGERAASGSGNGADDGIALEVLPPAIGRDDSASDSNEEEAPRPRRRTRRPRAEEGESDSAPAG